MSEEAEQRALDEVDEERNHEKDGEAMQHLQLGPVELEIPSEWEVEELRDEFDLVTGENYEGDHVHEQSDDDGKLFLSLKSVNKGGGFNWDSIKYYTGDVGDDHLVEPGDLLIANTDVTQDGDIVGYSVTVPAFEEDREIAVSMDLSILRPKNGMNKKFAEYLLQTDYIHSRMRAFSAGSTVLHLNTDLAEELSIPRPPLSEQRKIASVLYNVDEAIQKTEEIIEQTKRVKKGVMQEVFRLGLNEYSRFRNESGVQETYLGEIPHDWELRRVDDVCSEVVDCPHSTPDYEENTDDGILVARTSEMENGRFNKEEAPRVTEEEYEDRIARLEPESGDIIFTREAPIGEAIKIPQGMKICLGQRVMILRPTPEVLLSDYLLELIYSDMMQSWFERSARGSTSTHMNVEDVEELKIPLPDLDEQSQIATMLTNQREKIENERQYRSRLHRFKRALMQDLLTGEVRPKDRDIEVLPEVEAHG